MTQILDQHGAPIPAARIAAARNAGKISASSGFASSRYAGASRTSQELATFPAITLSADGAAKYERETLRARIRDLHRNEPRVSNATRKSAGMVIGEGWRLQAKPDARGLGITNEQARALGREIEREFKAWATTPGNYCDTSRQSNFGGLLSRAYEEYKTAGELPAQLRWREDLPTPYSTSVQIIDGDRLSNPDGRPDDEFLRDGIQLDAYGARIGMYIRDGHPSDYYLGANSHSWTYVPRQDAIGRPVGLYVMRPTRAGQTRGVTLFSGVIESLAMRSEMQKLELQSAVLNALFAFFVTTGNDADTVAAMMGLTDLGVEGFTNNLESKFKFYEDHPIKIKGATIPLLGPGDNLDSLAPARSANNFKDYNKVLTQIVAAAAGVAEGQISGDYTGLNYSTLRGVYNEVYSEVKVERGLWADQFVGQIYFAVLDEMIRKDRIDIPAGVPDLYEETAAWTASKWIGPARGHIDPEKEAKGLLLAREGGWKSFQQMCAEQGVDPDDVLTDEAELRRLCVEYDLPPDHFTAREGAFAPTAPRETES